MNALTFAVRAWRSARGLSLPIVDRLQDRRGVALTIDDGPTPFATPKILASLRRHNAKASFFLSGARAEAAPELVAKIAEDGHQIFNHGYAHLRLDRLDEAAIVEDVARAETILSHFRPTPSPYPIRLPFGEGWQTSAVHRALGHWRTDTHIVHWTRHADDWSIAPQCITADDIVIQCSAAANRLTAVRGLPGAILLLHDRPIDASHPLSDEVAATFTEQVLAALAARSMPCVPLSVG